MKLRGLFAFVLLTVSCVASRPDTLGSRAAAGASPEEPRREVLAALESYYTDFSARDWPAFSAHFWPGATLTTIWQPEGEPAPRVVISSIDEFVAKAPEGPGSREIFEERMESAEVRLTGDLAMVWARYTARFGDPGAVAIWRGIDAFTLMKYDGQWKIVALGFAADAGGPD